MRSRAGAAALMLLLAGCATNPATGERQLALISEQQELQMGRDAARQVRQTLAFVERPALQQYVARVGQQLAAASERPDLPWEFHVVDDPTPNAFALPGGFIYITRGMLNLMTSEAELASVLGHEVAHVTARHSVSQISQQQLAQLGFGLGGIFFPAVQQLSPFIGAGLQLLFLKHGRDDERQADEIGFRYVQARGYDASEMADVFATLQRAAPEEAGAVPGWLTTHPAPAERVETARARAQASPASDGRVAREAYLRAIDGLVYGDNPRHGFFRGAAFYHPDLRFRLQFPAGWQTQNLAQAVVGAAADGGAAIELTVVPVDDPADALRAFAAQPGIQIAPPVQRSLNGVPTVAADFMTTAAAGPVRGIVAFPRLGGRTYQLLGYTTANGWNAFGPELSAALASFGPLTDPEILAIEPNRIDVVAVGRPLTLSEFAQAYPSAVPVQELAVINHVAPDARFRQGTLVKRVVS